MITELDNFTASIASFNETTGADISILHPTVLVALVPNAGYNIIASNFNAVLPLPVDISNITFAQDGLNVNATITFISPFIMPQDNVSIPFCIDGFAELIMYSISGSISNSVSCNIGAYPASYSATGNFNTTTNVLTVPIIADSGYYFPTNPTLSLTLGNTNNYTLSSNKVFDISGNLIEVDFTIGYTFPNANIAGDVWSLNACAYEIYNPSIEITGYSCSLANILATGESRTCTLYGIPGANYSLTYSDKVGTPINTFTGVIGVTGIEAIAIIYPSTIDNDYYEFVLTGDLASSFDTILGQPSTWFVVQLVQSSLAFGVTSFNPAISVPSLQSTSYTPGILSSGILASNIFTVTSTSPMGIVNQPSVNDWTIPSVVAPPESNYNFSVFSTSLSLVSSYDLTVTVNSDIEFAGSLDWTSLLDLDAHIATLPEVITTGITNITSASASSGGNTIIDNNGPITAKGVEWSTDNFLSILGSTNDGTGAANYVSQISSIESLTTYYVRAYATNVAGTGYGEIVQFDTPSILGLDSYTTTDPDNEAGNNGTATIYFTGNAGPFTYTLGGPPPALTAVSPLELTGLEASTTYTVEITDSTANTLIVEFTLGESSFQFYADWVMVTYEFIDGSDLDTRSRIVSPNIGQITQPDMLGWAVSSAWPTTGTPIMTWGLDNTGIGFESVLMDINQFKAAYPTEEVIVGDFRCFWFDIAGIEPVKAACTLWKGGTPVKNGFIWENPTATETLNIDSVSLVIPGPYSPGYPDGTSENTTTGWRLATLTYDLATGIGVLNNADTTTPNV